MSLGYPRQSLFCEELQKVPPSSRTCQYIRWNESKEDFDIDDFDENLLPSINPSSQPDKPICAALRTRDLKDLLQELKKNEFYAPSKIPISCIIIPVTILALLGTITAINRTGPHKTEQEIRDRTTNFMRNFGIFVCFVGLLIVPIILIGIAKRATFRRSNRRVKELKDSLKRLGPKYIRTSGIDLRMSCQGSFLIIDTSSLAISESNAGFGLPNSFQNQAGSQNNGTVNRERVFQADSLNGISQTKNQNFSPWL